MEAYVNKLGLVLITKEVYASMESGSRKGSVTEASTTSDGTSTPSRSVGSVLRRKEHFEDIIRQSSTPTSSSHGEKVIESMRSLGYVPVASDEYKRLVENQKEYKPTRRDVLRTAKDFGLVAIPNDEYQLLLKRNKSVGSAGYPVDMLAVDDLCVLDLTVHSVVKEYHDLFLLQNIFQFPAHITLKAVLMLKQFLVNI